MIITIPKLSIIVPMYNEENTIGIILDKLYTLFSNSNYSFQIIVVDDGSSDRSFAIAEETMCNFTLGNHKLYKAEKNQGKGAAIRHGLEFVTGEFCVIQDADLECDPNDLLRMLDTIEKRQLNVLYGSRFLNKLNKKTYSLFYFGGRLVTFVANILYGQKLTDEPTCYKMFKSNILKSIPLKCTGFEFCPEVTAKIAKKGIKIKEIPISYYPRSVEEGKKLSWFDGMEAIWILIKYRFSK